MFRKLGLKAVSPAVERAVKRVLAMVALEDMKRFIRDRETERD